MKKGTWRAVLGCVLAIVLVFGLAGCKKGDLPDDDVPPSGGGVIDESGLRDSGAAYAEGSLYPAFYVSPTVHTINSTDMSQAELAMLVSLQGIVAQKEAAIFIYYNERHDEDGYGESGSYETWVNDIRSHYKNDQGKEIVFRHHTDVWEIVNLFRHRIKENGFVTFQRAWSYRNAPGTYNDSYNVATTMAGVKGWISVEAELRDRAVAEGFVEKFDASAVNDVYDYVYNQESCFNEFKDSLNKKLLFHQKSDNMKLRDYAVATKSFVFNVERNPSFEEGTTSEAFLKRVCEWAEPNTPVMGWTDDEVTFVKAISGYKKFMIPSDHAANLTVLSAEMQAVGGGAVKDGLKQHYKARSLAELKALGDKHFVAVHMSDGDNIQWYLNQILTGGNFIDSDAARKADFPMTYTISPSMYNLAPTVMKYAYDMKRTDGTYDYYAAGVSGVGYANPQYYAADYNVNHIGDEEYLSAQNADFETYLHASSDYMQKTDLSVVTILDPNYYAGVRNTSGNVEKWTAGGMQKVADSYGKLENVMGGIWEYGTRYNTGNGMVVFSENGKPFVTIRESLWSNKDADYKIDNNILTTTGKYTYGPRYAPQATADRINAYPVKPDSIEGYTVVNVLPWQYSMGDVQNMVDCFDEDVEVVSSEELLTLVAANVPHVAAGTPFTGNGSYENEMSHMVKGISTVYPDKTENGYEKYAEELSGLPIRDLQKKAEKAGTIEFGRTYTFADETDKTWTLGTGGRMYSRTLWNDAVTKGSAGGGSVLMFGDNYRNTLTNYIYGIFSVPESLNDTNLLKLRVCVRTSHNREEIRQGEYADVVSTVPFGAYASLLSKNTETGLYEAAGTDANTGLFTQLKLDSQTIGANITVSKEEWREVIVDLSDYRAGDRIGIMLGSIGKGGGAKLYLDDLSFFTQAAA